MIVFKKDSFHSLVGFCTKEGYIFSSVTFNILYESYEWLLKIFAGHTLFRLVLLVLLCILLSFKPKIIYGVTVVVDFRIKFCVT